MFSFISLWLVMYLQYCASTVMYFPVALHVPEHLPEN